MWILRLFVVGLTCSGRMCEEIVLMHPECRSPANCVFSPLLSSYDSGTNTFVYKVSGSGENNDTRTWTQLNVQYNENKKLFKVCCNCDPRLELTADDPAVPAMWDPTIVETVEFRGCSVPNVPYHQVLQDLNVTLSRNNGILWLTELPDKPQLERDHLKGLDIIELFVTGANIAAPTRPKENFLDGLSKLKRLSLTRGIQPERNVIRRLPVTLENLELWSTKLLHGNGSLWLQRLPSLTSLDVAEPYIDHSEELVVLPPLAQWPNLTSLSMCNVSLKLLSNNTSFLNGSKVQSLALRSCKLKTIPPFIFEGSQLTKVTLDYNELTSLPKKVFTPLSQSLRELDLSNNKLTGTSFVHAVHMLKQLTILKANNNPLGSLCGFGTFYATVPSKLPLDKLQRLELRETGATRICNDWVENHFLRQINLDGNNISYLWYEDLKMSRIETKPVVMTLRKNFYQDKPLQIIITKNDVDDCHEQSSKKVTSYSKLQRVPVRLQLNSLACDCNVYWFHKILHCNLLEPQSVDKVSCLTSSGKIPLLSYEAKNLTCPYKSPCPESCTCNKRQHDNATVVQCNGTLSRATDWPPSAPKFPLALHVAPGKLDYIPRNVSLVELHAIDNNIASIDEGDIGDTLRVLDLRNNHIANISSAAAQRLLHLSTKEGSKVSLAGNILACKCEDEIAIATLKLAKITDWNTTHCADGNLVIGKTNFCLDKKASQLPVLLGMTGVLLILTSITLIIFCLRPRIRQYLFDHNLCLSCVLNVKDDADDPMKTHDVFISYSNYDLIIAKKLIGKLEDRGYSTIEHCRDWMPGETITQQITHSVMSARRTLLIVSDNYAESQWGLAEFHAAHAHAMELGSARVIVVKCQLLAPEKLPKDLQVYLKSNTYLEWSDRYFWKKLLNVMPPPRPIAEPAISLLGDKAVLPSVRSKLRLSLPRQSLEKEPPLSELVLSVPVEQYVNSRMGSGQASPVTVVVQEPPQLGDNKSHLLSNMRRQILKAPTKPVTVPPCAF